MNHTPEHPRFRTPFKKLLSQARMDDVNAGLMALFPEIKAAMGSDKLIVWNGFWRKKHTIDRSLALMPLGDVSLSERWCTAHQEDESVTRLPFLSRSEILTDLELVRSGLAAGKLFLPADTVDEKWYARASRSEIERVARFGWAMYMLIHEHGRTAYSFSAGPRFAQNYRTDPVELQPRSFGNPRGSYQEDGAVLYREFEHGVVYVNPTESNVQVTVSGALDLLHGEGVPARVEEGNEVTIPAQDAVIFGR
jgi:hypothetical protein